MEYVSQSTYSPRAHIRTQRTDTNARQHYFVLDHLRETATVH
jgi:hypothetical protein